MHREKPPALPVGIDPQFDRKLNLPVHILQPDYFRLKTGEDRTGVCEWTTGPFGLHEEDLPVLPGNQVNRGPRSGTPDHAETPLPKTVPGQILNPASPGIVRV